MTSVYSPRWTAPEEPIARHCDMPECRSSGEYRAPKHRGSADMKDYHWFCLDHVKQYNQSWNYFSGMADSEMEDFWREAQTGHRPTWKRGSQKQHTRETLTEDVYRSFADYLASGEAKYAKGGAKLVPIDRLTQKSLAVLDMEWPVSEREVKLRYKHLVKQYHPDINQTEGAADYFKKITEAYHQLKTAVKKHAAGA